MSLLWTIISYGICLFVCLFILNFVLVVIKSWKEVTVNLPFAQKYLYSIRIYDDRHSHPDYGSFRVQFYIYCHDEHSEEEVLAFGEKLIHAYLETNNHVHIFMSNGQLGVKTDVAMYDSGRSGIPDVNIEMSVEECQKRIEWESAHQRAMKGYLK